MEKRVWQNKMWRAYHETMRNRCAEKDLEVKELFGIPIGGCMPCHVFDDPMEKGKYVLIFTGGYGNIRMTEDIQKKIAKEAADRAYNKKFQIEYQKKQRENLTDQYVVQSLVNSGLPRKLVKENNEIIHLHRTFLLTKQKLKLCLHK